MPKQNSNNQPLFYSKPTPLMLERHADAGLSRDVDYLFSKNVNFVPLTIQEFAESAKYYPIVFTSNNSADPLVILGHDNNKNIFVSADGQWAKDKYVPAYIRRYPFAFLAQEDKLILCVDEDSKNFVKKAKANDLRFFDGDIQTKSTKFILDFCTQFHKDYISTQNFSKTMKDMGLLKPKQWSTSSKDKKNSKTISGFDIIDESKVKNLDAKTLQDFHKNGFLALIYFHLLSLSNFNRLSR